MTPYVVPSLFSNNWQPQVMPNTNMALENNFNNFNLASLGAQQQYPPSNYPPNSQQPNFGQGQGPQQNMGQTQGYGQGPQQNMGNGSTQNMGQAPGYGQGPQQNYGNGPQQSE
jgi:hypothetical protein